MSIVPQTEDEALLTKKPGEGFEEEVDKLVKERKIITFYTYALTDEDEKKINIILNKVLSEFNRIELFELCYTAVKELLVNATKASYKRLLFKQKGLDINNPADYEKGMEHFKAELTEKNIVTNIDELKQNNLIVALTFYYNENVLNIKVKNNFILTVNEEKRIREKFKKAQKYNDLIEFYMDQSDETEGAGMGITMVEIMLYQSGIDKHAFTIYSTEKYKETIAKLEIPLSPSYIPKRKYFDEELKRTGLTPEELRKSFNYNYKKYMKK